MRRLIVLSIATFFALLPTARAERDVESRIDVPSLGMVFDREAAAIRPLLGTLGAAITGRSLSIGFPVESAALRSEGDFGIVVSSEDHRARVVRFNNDHSSVEVLDGVDPSPGRIVLSPSGAAAMLYYVNSGRVQVISGLPDAAAVSREFSIAGVRGTVTGLALRDDGSQALLVVEENQSRSLWSLDAGTGVFPIMIEGSPAAAAFRRGGDEAIVATLSGELYVLRASAITKYGAVNSAGGRPVGVQLSRDGRHVYLAYSEGDIVDVEAISGSTRTVSCGCRPTVLEAMKDASMFRINEASSLPLLLIDSSESKPRVWFIPPDASGLTVQRGDK